MSASATPLADSDFTGDGLNITEEKEAGTNPFTNDTANTGVSDYDAVNIYKIDPKDDEIRITDLDSETFESDNNIHNSNPLSDGTWGGAVSTDTSGDGISDTMSEDVDKIDTDTKDIIVEIDWHENAEPELIPLLKTQQEFHSSPTNSDMKLHFVINDEPRISESKINHLEYSDIQSELGINDNGMHHAAFVEESYFNDEKVGGFALLNTEGFVVAESNGDSMGGLFMHELGHSIGLWPELYDGIDSFVDIDDYPSIMNYEMMEKCYSKEDVEHCYTFDDGVGFDDWGYIDENYDEYAPSTKNA